MYKNILIIVAVILIIIALAVVSIPEKEDRTPGGESTTGTLGAEDSSIITDDQELDTGV
jgi:hypothetical protein